MRLVIHIALPLALILGFARPGLALDAAALKTEMSGDKALGSASAPVTLIEYASLSCSHCAAFHHQVLPVLQKEYIDTGKLRYIFRDYPLNGAALFASLVTHCSAQQGGDEKYFAVLKDIMEQQSMWRQSGSSRASLLLIATGQGIDGKKLTACIDDDKALEERIITSRKDANEQLGIKKTPAFLVNGELIESLRTPAEARQAIDAALAKAAQSSSVTQPKGAKP